MEIIVKNFDENNKKDRSIKTTKKAKDKVDKNNKSDVEQVRRTLQLVVSVQFCSKTALRIFLIFCMKVPYYKSKKRARRFFRKNSGSLIIHENVPKNGPK